MEKFKEVVLGVEPPMVRIYISIFTIVWLFVLSVCYKCSFSCQESTYRMKGRKQFRDISTGSLNKNYLNDSKECWQFSFHSNFTLGLVRFVSLCY